MIYNFYYICYKYITNIQTLDTQKSVAVYPNPTNGKITIETFTSKNSFELYESSGILLQRSFTTNFKSEIDLSCLSSGIYLLRIIHNNITIHKRIFKY